MDLNPFNQNKKKTKKKVYNNQNFIEALKSIGGGVTSGAKDAARDLAANTFNTAVTGEPLSASGDLSPGGSVEFDQLQKEQEEQKKKAEHRRLHVLRSKEHTVFSAKKEQTKKQIQGLQEELKKLAQELGSVAKEVQVAAIQEVADPGQYHVGFFEHLKRLIHALRKQLHDSASWLHSANDRASRKKGFWGLHKSKGTKFSQSQELKMSHSSG